MTVERRPSRTGLALTTATALFGAVVASLGGGLVALVGVPLVVLGVRRTSRTLLVGGVAALLAGVVFAGLADADPLLVLGGMVGTVLAWDVGETAISVAEQLRTGDSDRLEAVHAATSALVASGVAVGGYVVFSLSSGGQPAVALSLLVFGTVLVLIVLGR